MSAQTIQGQAPDGTYVPVLVDDDGKLLLATGGGVGDVTGAASSTDNAVARFDGTTGKVIQNSVVTIDDTGTITTTGGGAFDGAVFLNGAVTIDGSTTGTQIGTTTAKKVGFFGATPVVQPTATADIGGLLGTLGLRATGSNYGIATGGTVKFDGAFKQTPTNRSANLSVTATQEQYNFFDATAAARTVTLITAVGNGGLLLTFKKTDASANAVTINTVSAQTIDGSASYSLATQHKYVTMISDGANWKIVGNN